MFKGKKFIYCADAGLGSLNIRNFNSMGGRAFIVTQSIKKLSAALQQSVFSDTDYHLLSSDEPAVIKDMKEFDRHDPENRELYNDRIYKIIPADKAFDLGLHEEKEGQNGPVRKMKSKAVVPQKIIVSFSRKMMEYQRYIRNRQIDRAKKLLKIWIRRLTKKGHMMSHVLSNELRPQNPAKRLPINIPLISPLLKKKRNMMVFMLLQQIWMILPKIF